jgi:PEP-CTERM motif
MLRYAIATVVLIALFAIPLSATSFTSDEVVETMMETEGVDTLYVGLIFGPDAASVLHFISNVNLSTGAFSYSLVSGQMYLGSAFSLTTTGIFNSSLGEFVWTSTAQLGAQQWSGNGALTWSGDPDDFGHTQTAARNGVTYNVTIKGKRNEETSIATYAVTKLDGTDLGTFNGTDLFNKKEGKWQHTVKLPNGTLNATGVTPSGGGVGAFNVTITPVPEPSSLTLLGLGVSSLFAFGRKAYLRRSSAGNHDHNR